MAFRTDLGERLDEAAQRHGVPGAAIAVASGDELAEAATGVVNRNTGVATTPDTVFQIGSVTKVWTAALVMQLVDEGLVDLDRPVRRYLPEFAVVDAEVTETVTARQLLSHTGGFLGDLFEDTGRGDDALDRYLAYLPTAATQVHPPGAMFSYCNSGYCVLGALVAKLRGGTWESVLRERLIGPLGVTHMALLAEEAVLFLVAAGHLKPHGADDSRVTGRWQLPRSNAPVGATPCAAPRELVRLGRMFLAGGVAVGNRLLSADAVAAMREPQVTLPDLGGVLPAEWGLGFMRFDWNGTPVIGHDGGTIGQSAFWRVVPEHGFVIAITANGGNMRGLIRDVAAPVVAEVTGVRIPPRPVPPAEPPPVPLGRYPGRYVYPMGEYEVHEGDAGLDVTVHPKGLPAELGETPVSRRYVPLRGNVFISAEPEDGFHEVFAFVDGGRYLHVGRALPRASGDAP